MNDIKLEPFFWTDIPRLLRWVRSEEFLVQWAGPYFTHPLDEMQLLKYWESGQGENAGRRIYKSLIYEPDPVVIGHIELNNPSCYQRKLRLAARTKRPTFSSNP